jgi:TRAP-type mannitol/chloroaromatic compound transport system permease large subunit
MTMRKELWFGFTIMALIVGATVIFMPWGNLTNGHYGLMMLSLVVVAIMLGFPTAFTLMGMGMIFAYFAYHSQGRAWGEAMQLTLDLMVQRTYAVMANDVLISIPLFVFMGYLVERANLIEKLFKSLHLALARIPGSLAVATLVTCAVFATATGIVGAVVTLMGLLAMPTMLRAGYSVNLSSGAITAGGCLGILIPPSVMLIVYGATAGVSVVQLYAGAFFPGLMLAGLYIAYVIIVAKLKPETAPPLPESERTVALPSYAERVLGTGRRNALAGFFGALAGRVPGVSPTTALGQLGVALAPAIVLAILLGMTFQSVTAPIVEESYAGLEVMGGGSGASASDTSGDGVQEPRADDGGVSEPKAEEGVQEPPGAGAAAAPADVQEPPGATPPASASTDAAPADAAPAAAAAAAEPREAPLWFWITAAIIVAALAVFYLVLDLARLEIYKMLLTSFFPLAMMILAVLGTIVFGLATPTEAAAVGSLGGFLLAIAYRWIEHRRNAPGRVLPVLAADVGRITKESTFLTAKTSAMVCWLFVGSSIFSAAFALLGGQELIEKWVLSLGLSKIQFMLLSQFIIFILGWPLEWTEIIVIFMPIFIPLLAHFEIDPLFFGLLVALNLQTAFLSPPVAMAAFYLKGVAPPHVTLNQIFAGMIPFMVIQVVALALLYVFPGIGLWLPQVLYK